MAKQYYLRHLLKKIKTKGITLVSIEANIFFSIKAPPFCGAFFVTVRITAICESLPPPEDGYISQAKLEGAV